MNQKMKFNSFKLKFMNLNNKSIDLTKLSNNLRKKKWIYKMQEENLKTC